MRYSKEESKMIWDQNAEFWDYTMDVHKSGFKYGGHGYYRY